MHFRYLYQYIYILYQTYISPFQIIAVPHEPFPSIDACNSSSYTESGQSCVITTPSINITCSVRAYFPNISLTFCHKSENVSRIAVESVNSDGTKNKLVTIGASPNDEPYICTASNFLDSPDYDKSAVIYIKALPQLTTTGTTVSFNQTDATKDNQTSIISEYAAIYNMDVLTFC